MYQHHSWLIFQCLKFLAMMWSQNFDRVLREKSWMKVHETIAWSSVSRFKNYFEQACDLPEQVFHKSKTILGKHVTCLIKCFTSQKLFWVSMWLAWASVSQVENYFGQAWDLPEQVFHKSKSILGKHVTCLGKAFTTQNYFEHACDLPDQVFHNTKTILDKHVTYLSKFSVTFFFSQNKTTS